GHRCPSGNAAAGHWVRPRGNLTPSDTGCRGERVPTGRSRAYDGRVCTLAAFVRVFPAYPLVVAANRDEYLERPATPPTLLRDAAPRAMGGRDLRANGTWLGVNEAGVVVGVLNRRSPAPPDPARRSRGQLCTELLGCDSASAAAARAAGEPDGQ